LVDKSVVEGGRVVVERVRGKIIRKLVAVWKLITEIGNQQTSANINKHQPRTKVPARLPRA
jgi:hypothetical protein